MSSDEPIYIRQTAEPEHLGSPLAWCRDAAADGRKEGASFFRCSALGKKGLRLQALLIEGWKEQPEDQGAPRWQLAAKAEVRTRP